jgi:hypothetical protein
MLKRLSSILYFVTAVATLDAGLTSFNNMRIMLTSFGFKWSASASTIYFAAPALFLLASLEALKRDNTSRFPKWISAAVTLAAAGLMFAYAGLGWEAYLEAAGALGSLVLISGSLVSRASAMAAIGAITYFVVEAPLLIPWLKLYWYFGGSVQHFIAKIVPPIFVLASLAMAVVSHFIARKENSLATASPSN